MKTCAELGREYLETADKILQRLNAAEAEIGPDYGGKRAKRIRCLTEMYWECRVMGHYLLRRGGNDPLA